MRYEQQSCKSKKGNKIKYSSHFMHISSYTSSLVLLSINEEKLVALPVNSSFKGVATSYFRNNSVATSISS